ncbi:aldo/keto reductase [Oerskovia turbata]
MTSIPSAHLPGGDIPLLGLGTWQATGDECYRAVRHALDVGYRHIDTATMYGNEEQVGRALAASGVPRSDVFLTTKLRPADVGHEHEALAQSLRLLGTDHLDLWLIHWPPSGDASPWVWAELLAARNAGLVRSVGVSNYSVDQLDVLSEQTGETPAVNQIPWGPGDYDAHVVEQHSVRGVVIEGYSPLKRADLSSPVLQSVAKAHGVTTAQVVLRWHLDHGFVAIPKSVTPARIEENLAVTGFALTPDEVARIDTLG